MDDDEQGAEVLDQAEKEENHEHFYNYLERYLQFNLMKTIFVLEMNL